MMDLINYFEHPQSKRQKQYEAIRAYVIDNVPIEQIAEKYGYQPSTIYSILRNAKSGKLKLFPEVIKGPKQRRTQLEIQNKIIQLRKQNLSAPSIHEKLKQQEITVSISTIERILKDAGFDRLKRRTFAERGITPKNKIIPQRAAHLDFSKLEPFHVDCPVAGIFFFLPYIIESKIIDIVSQCSLPESSEIDSVHACLSMLLLKLIGNERLSHMESYDQEPGLGAFAGLNILPKSGYMSTYSCRTSEEMLYEFQQQIVEKLFIIYPHLYQSSFINLDFHSIPHYGDESEMERVWCGARGKSMKGANSVFAQDGSSNAILYTRADILRREESQEIKKFIDYWRSIKGQLDETLVFDCKFTKYSVLDKLTEDGVKFITLRKRSQKLLDMTSQIPKDQWKRVRLPILKRKHKNLLVCESEVILKDCHNIFRQVIIRNHGRANPTFVITNNFDLTRSLILEVYAKRWHIENKLAELVSFFNLNALSSPLMVRIHFDILWTIIADTLYHQFARDLRRFEKNTSVSIFKKFINFPGKVVYDGNKFVVKIRKRAYTPVLLGVEKLNKPIKVPWLDNREIEIIWTA